MTKKKEQPAKADSGLMFDVGSDDRIVRTSTAVVEGKPASVDIEAEAIMPGIECPFTDGCNGKVKIHSDITKNEEQDGKVVQTRVQQYRCGKCNKLAKGFRVVGRHEGRKFFNRVSGKAEG